MNIQAGANTKKLRVLRQLFGNDELCTAADIVPSTSVFISAFQSDTFSAECGFDISNLEYDSCGVLKAIPKLPMQQRKTNRLNTGYIFDVFCLNKAKT